MKLEFPKGFYWGSATSAHQVEGGNHNDWTEWEKKTGKERSGRACDHYNRFREDFDIAKSLSHNAHRFSIEWSRIEPEEGQWDEKEIEHYRQVISALRERELEPFVTLWHYTHPIWFAKRGGWGHKDAIKSFLKFIEIVVKDLPEVKYWIVLNEPETFARHAYFLEPFGMGRPPQRFSIIKYFLVLRTLVKAQQEAYKLIHRIAGDKVKVSFAESLVYFEAYKNLPYNVFLKTLLNWWRNKLFVPKVINYCDFIGVNYYFHTRIRFNFFKSRWGIQFNENKEISDFGWEIYPEGIYHVLKDLKQYNKPIYITENGVADARDVHREKFIKEHLKWVHKAIFEGVDVQGYFYWSLLDNFEWDKGFWPRFGLVEVDYKTMSRRTRQSALEYKIICQDNALEI